MSEVRFFNEGRIEIITKWRPSEICPWEDSMMISVNSISRELHLRRSDKKTYRDDPLLDVCSGGGSDGYLIPIGYLNAFLFRIRFIDYPDKRQQELIRRYQYDLYAYLRDFESEENILEYVEGSLVLDEWNKLFTSWNGHFGVGPFMEEPDPISMLGDNRALPFFAETNRPGGVYVLRCGDLFKIGYSRDVRSRVMAINAQSPVDVEHVITIHTSNARHLESLLHRSFADKRVKGEWFRLSDEDVASLNRPAWDGDPLFRVDDSNTEPPF